MEIKDLQKIMQDNGVVGAGGAGFMIFYVPEEKHEAVRKALSHLREMDFEMDNSGASIVMTDRDFI